MKEYNSWLLNNFESDCQYSIELLLFFNSWSTTSLFDDILVQSSLKFSCFSSSGWLTILFSASIWFNVLTSNEFVFQFGTHSLPLSVFKNSSQELIQP